MDEHEGFNRRDFGAEHEDIALNYLLGLGYRLLKKNFRFGRAGEIDIVMRDGPVYVFVEVKARRSHGFGLPEESITMAKRRTIRKVAEGYAFINQLDNYEARFDVVAIDYVTGTNGRPEIRHYIGAF
ncbi:MAG TPA: YraN family protein [Candidatus Kapabacteria bacterium]|nr:YraN family protein [Candidatus Kapabacteria bacterium]